MARFRYNGSTDSVVLKVSEAIITAPYDYEQIRNKPAIEGKELSGDLTLEDIGILDITKPEIDNLGSDNATEKDPDDLTDADEISHSDIDKIIDGSSDVDDEF